MNRIIWIVIDSVGVGALPDAKAFGDEGVNTLGHIVKEFNDIKIPNMVKLGLGNIDGIDYIKNVDSPIGSFGRCNEVSQGKDTTCLLYTSHVKTNYANKHVLIVVRGQDYKQDLSTIISYIEEMKPILVGVDGGADALLEFGYTPDVIVGDMDSVSDEALKKAKEIIVHAYTDGRAPGLKRVNDLGLDAIVFPAPGTSEDIAMLIAYEYKAELIVALGTHSNMIDFLEKGRKGMASTFLVRLKIGAKLIDAKGVNLLYRSKLKMKYIWALIATALFPILIIASFTPSVKQFMHLMQLKLRLLLQM